MIRAFSLEPAREALFVVYGTPQPKGSMRAFVRGGFAKITNASPKTKPWEYAVASSAQAAMGDLAPFVGAIEVRLVLYLQRRKGHLRKDGSVKPTAPMWPATKPDADKYLRAVLDALTGICYVDDGQVVRVLLEKRFGAPGAEILVRQMGSGDGA
jgi:Holliday junction resolvase RusA-like endonuclease